MAAGLHLPSVPGATYTRSTSQLPLASHPASRHAAAGPARNRQQAQRLKQHALLVPCLKPSAARRSLRPRAEASNSAPSPPWKQKNARLVLEDGSVWHGVAFGATGQAVGEVVFNTSMSGYQVGT